MTEKKSTKPARVGRERVHHPHLGRERLRLHEVLVSVVAVAQVRAGGDVVGHGVDAAREAADDPVEVLVRLQLQVLRRFEHPDLDGDIPLHGEQVVWDVGQQRVQVLEQRALV